VIQATLDAKSIIHVVNRPREPMGAKVYLPAVEHQVVDTVYSMRAKTPLFFF